MGIITFNGKSSQDIFVVEHPPEYGSAERNYDIISVPGRNGDLTMDRG
jgi:phage-related protein